MYGSECLLLYYLALFNKFYEVIIYYLKKHTMSNAFVVKVPHVKRKYKKSKHFTDEHREQVILYKATNKKSFLRTI